jgi:hypothetical protein
VTEVLDGLGARYVLGAALSGALETAFTCSSRRPGLSWSPVVETFLAADTRDASPRRILTQRLDLDA